MEIRNYSNIAFDLESAGLYWTPMIGDEICKREYPEDISLLVNSATLTPEELRNIYIWRPSVEQIVFQLEARQAVLKHAGLDLSTSAIEYLTIIETNVGEVISRARSLRSALALSLKEFLAYSSNGTH